MNILCNICSEFLINNNEASVTMCGHGFHRDCITDWLKNSRTCPTCRQATSQASLIKVFFETDQNKLNDLHNELLTKAEKLSKELETLSEKSRQQENDMIRLTGKYRETNEKLKESERQKQLDDMAIAGLNMIRKDSAKEILKLNAQINILKVDLLAEKQLRRIHQATLHKLDPKNEEFDIKSIVIDDHSLNQHANYSIVPFWQFSSEAGKKEPEKKDKPYVVPSKIQKAQESMFPSSSHLGQKRSSNREDNFVTSEPSSFKALVPAKEQSNQESAQPKVSFSFNFANTTGLSSLFRFGSSDAASSSQNSSPTSTTATFSNYRDKSEMASPRPSER